MKCDRCDNPATFHFTRVQDHQVTTLHLCAECAKKEGLPAGGVSSMTVWLMKKNPDKVEEPQRLTARLKACPECRLTIARLRKEGRLGCPKCYEVFEEELKEILQSTHGATEHHGRNPRHPSEYAWKEEQRRLQQRLEAAIQAEAYEEAARLRDELRSLQARHSGAAS